MSLLSIGYKDTEANILGNFTCFLSLWPLALGKPEAILLGHFLEAHVGRIWRLWPTSSPQKNQILPTKKCVILEIDPSSVGSSDKTATNADSLTTTPGETFSQNILVKLSLDYWQTRTVDILNV